MFYFVSLALRNFLNLDFKSFAEVHAKIKIIFQHLKFCFRNFLKVFVLR